MEYTLYYIIVFTILLLAELLYVKIARRLHIGVQATTRSSHKGYKISGGGIIFIVSAILFWITTALGIVPPIGHPAFSAMMAGAILLAVICFIDDVRNLSPMLRLIVQLLVVSITLHHAIDGYGIATLLAMLIVGIGIINAYNFMDGINGMMAGYSIVTFGTLFYALHSTQYTPFIGTLIAASIVFALFNFRKKAICFSGDVGSIVNGFFILYLILVIIDATQDFSIVVILSCYAVDCVYTIFQRIRNKENILQSHRRHLYQMLSLKIPQYRVSLSYASLQLAINTIYFLLPETLHSAYCLLTYIALTGACFRIKTPIEKELRVSSSL